MIKLFHLLYIHLLSIFDINQVFISSRRGEKTTFPLKTIVLFIVSFLYSYIFYFFLSKFALNGYDKLNITFLLSTLFCFFYDFQQIHTILFQAEDTSFLFSFPIKRSVIILSKLFSVYLKNMFFVFLFFFSAILAVRNTISINDTFVLLYFVMAFFVPFLPLVVSSIFSFFFNYIKVKWHLFFQILFVFGIFALLGAVLYAFKDSLFSFSSLESLYQSLLYYYPLAFLFFCSLQRVSLLHFFVYLLLNILVVYLYVLCISSDYEKYCSLLRGVKKKKSFQYKKRKNRKIFFGFFHKELLYLFKNTLYFKSSFFLSILFSFLLFIFFFFFAMDFSFSFASYFNLYGPLFCATIGALSISTIHSFSLERENLNIIRSLPISFAKVFFSKLLVNLFLGSIIILFNATFLWIFVKPNLFVTFMLYVFPLFALFMNSFVSLLLDCLFIDDKNRNESSIIKERLITIIPLFLSILFFFSSFLFINLLGYKNILGVDLLICIIVVIFCFLLYFFKRNFLIKRVFHEEE